MIYFLVQYQGKCDSQPAAQGESALITCRSASCISSLGWAHQILGLQQMGQLKGKLKDTPCPDKIKQTCISPCALPSLETESTDFDTISCMFKAVWESQAA